jgi:signal transduction histidine kinase
MLADSDRLLATVEQVLKAGELGARRPQDRTLIELTPLVSDCIAITLLRHHLQPEAIQLAPVPGNVRLHVRAVSEDLRTAVLNLLENAVKYSPDSVEVRCSLSIVEYSNVALTVTDTGVGLPTDQLKRIFKRFYRVPGRNAARIRGTGLGLFLVRAIARQHGGSISAASPGPNLGATITLTLPLADPAAHTPAQ